MANWPWLGDRGSAICTQFRRSIDQLCTMQRWCVVVKKFSEGRDPHPPMDHGRDRHDRARCELHVVPSEGGKGHFVVSCDLE